jgi:hypothetical protein
MATLTETERHHMEFISQTFDILEEQKNDYFAPQGDRTYEKARNCQTLLGPIGMQRRCICINCDTLIADQDEKDTVFETVYIDNGGFLGVLCPNCSREDFWAAKWRVVRLTAVWKDRELKAPLSSSTMIELHDCTTSYRAQYSRSQKAWLFMLTNGSNQGRAWTLEQLRQWNPDLVIPNNPAEFLEPVTERVRGFLMGSVPMEAMPPLLSK